MAPRQRFVRRAASCPALVVKLRHHPSAGERRIVEVEAPVGIVHFDAVESSVWETAAHAGDFVALAGQRRNGDGARRAARAE